MKYLFSILALLLMTKECDQKSSDKVSTKTEIVSNEETARQQQEECTIQYTALSRGFYNEININSSTISFKKSRVAEADNKTCSKEVWSALMSKLDSIDVKNISKLEAPTKKRFYDGAAIATIKVILKDTTYQSSEFDHGYPPEEIKLLCDKILEISEGKKNN